MAKITHSIEDRQQPDYLSGDMTPSDFVEVLRSMRFGNGFKALQVDKDARDFLVSVIARRGKSTSA